MTDTERYLAAVTVAAGVLYVLLLARRAVTHADIDCRLADRSLILTDAAFVVLAAAALTRNTLGLEGATGWLAAAWTIVIACAAARLLGPARSRPPSHEG